MGAFRVGRNPTRVPSDREPARSDSVLDTAYPDAMKGTYRIDIDRPREDVFAFLDDEENLSKVVPNLVDQGIVDETPERVGTTFWDVYEEKGRRMKMTGVARMKALIEGGGGGD